MADLYEDTRRASDHFLAHQPALATGTDKTDGTHVRHSQARRTMSRMAGFSSRALLAPDLRNGLQIAISVFVAYCIAAEVAFFVGTLSDKIFAPFWPPNIILLCALLLVPNERRWICIVAAFVAHIIAESRIGMPPSQLIVAFVTNLAVALLSAVAIEWLMGEPPWFRNFSKVARFVVAVGFACPALVALGGAFVPILGGGSLRNFPEYWMQWLASNALGSLTLGPVALILVSEGFGTFWSPRIGRQAEALLLGSSLILVCDVAFRASAGHSDSAFFPALLYLPVPLILWSAARFGAKGAGAAILAMTVVLVWRALNGPSLFLAGTPEANAFALQIFVVSLAVPVLLLGSSVDEAREAEQKVREDEERMAFAAATANIGLWQHNVKDNWFWATDHCRAMFGFQKNSSVTHDRILAAVHPEDRRVAADAIAANLASPDASPAEFRVILPDEQIKWLLARSHPRLAEDGTVLGTTGIFTDVTARKIAETESELQRRELAHLMRVSQVGELSGGLAHELTQPLTAILANAQAARAMMDADKPDLAEITEVLDDIIQEDHRAGDVIHRLRTLLKNGNGSFQSVDLNELINSTLRLLRSELVGRHIKASVLLVPDLPPISGDPVQLQQVLLNLVMNAIDAVHQMTTLRRVITLKTRYIGDAIEVSVCDRGTGISGSDQARLFEPFFTTKERGLGLGLSICSTIIKRHGGTLSLDNNPDGGATGRFRLPSKLKEDVSS